MKLKKIKQQDYSDFEKGNFSIAEWKALYNGLMIDALSDEEENKSKIELLEKVESIINRRVN